MHRICKIEADIEMLGKAIAKLLEHHERHDPHTGVSIGGAAHKAQPIHDFTAWYRSMFLPNG